VPRTQDDSMGPRGAKFSGSTPDMSAGSSVQLAPLSNDREFASLMQLVYTNHGEAQRSHLDFSPNELPY
jgi:hypothetical protein